MICILEVYLATVLVRNHQRNRTSRMCIFRKCCLIRIACVIMEVDSPKICKLAGPGRAPRISSSLSPKAWKTGEPLMWFLSKGWQDLGRVHLSVWVQGRVKFPIWMQLGSRNSLSLREGSILLYKAGPSTEWTRPTPTREDNLLCPIYLQTC